MFCSLVVAQKEEIHYAQNLQGNSEIIQTVENKQKINEVYSSTGV